MSVRPYTKKKAKPGEKWWLIDIGRGAARTQVPFEGTYEDAAEHERQLWITFKGKDDITKTMGTVRVKNLVLDFLKWYRENYSPQTVRDMRYSFDLYIVPKFGNLHPAHIPIGLFTELMSEMREKGLSHTTINKHLNYFSSMLKWGVQQKKCDSLPYAIPKFPKNKTLPKNPVEPLTRKEVEGVLAKILPKYRLPVMLMIDHGLRLSEALNVRIEHIDEERQIINVVGKGNKKRIVPFMSDRFERELIEATSQRYTGFLTVSCKRTKKAKEAGEEQPLKTLWKELKRAANEAGVRRKINHHVLRHTFATLAAEAGINPHALQQILGHSSIETTNKIYTKVRQDFVGNEANLLRQKVGK